MAESRSFDLHGLLNEARLGKKGINIGKGILNLELAKKLVKTKGSVSKVEMKT